jgi:hypothetical protein
VSFTCENHIFFFFFNLKDKIRKNFIQKARDSHMLFKKRASHQKKKKKKVTNVMFIE